MPVDRPRDPYARSAPPRHRRFAAAGLLVAVVAATAPAANAEIGDDADVSVWPAPRELTQRDDGFPLPPVVGLVAGDDTDAGAEETVRDVLREAGVREIVTGQDDPGTPVTVWLDSGGHMLSELGVASSDELGSEGYVLAAGRAADDRGHIVLDGVDADGAFYGAQTFEQLVRPRQGTDWMPGVEVRDEPTMEYRGLIEGFYGTPWSHADRLALMDYLGTHRMNTFEYAPKDDPYHREKWREPYPADELADLGELVDRATANRVDFTFALSPGLSICYSSQEDFAAVIAKFEALYELGARSFNIPLDDIDYNSWHCDEDVERFGTGAAAAGKAQAHLLNRVQREWVATKDDVGPLQMVPTEYYNVSESPYKRALREDMDADVVVMWTGTAVVPEEITVADAEKARQVFGHEILVWDNYPVNDYEAGRLLLAPYSGRENGLSEQVAGVVSNPMNQAALSELALFSFAEFGWNDLDFDAMESWTRATVELTGGDTELASAFRAFADLNWYDGTLHRQQSPLLTEELAVVRQLWDEGRHAEARAHLRDTLERYATATTLLRDLPDPRAGAELEAWLDAAEAWLAAGEATVDMLAAFDADDRAEAWRQRNRVTELVGQAKAVRDDKEPHSSTWPRIADGVLDTAITDLTAIVDEWFGVGVGTPTADTNLPSYRGHEPVNMLDGDSGTYFWSGRGTERDDYVGVELDEPTDIGRIDVLMGKSDSPDDYIREGVLEYSVDGQEWTELAKGTTPEVTATAPDGTRARYVRYRATADGDGSWLVVREFAVETPDAVVHTADGGPPAEEGGSLTRVIDGDADTAYAAARAAEPGEALVVTASQTRPLEALTVLQAPDSATGATVQARQTSGEWVSVGELSGGHTRLDLDGEKADAVRLLWADEQAPVIYEIVPSWGD